MGWGMTMDGYGKSPVYVQQGLWRLVLWLLLMLSVSGLLTWPALAEDQLCPKSGQCVPASAFDCRDVNPSIGITRVCYSAEKQYMIMQLREDARHFCSIPPDVVSAFLAADSMINFYAEHIKHNSTRRYDCRVHPVPTF